MSTIFTKAQMKLANLKNRALCTLASKKGEGYVDTAMKAIIGVVIGGLILTLLYTLFKTNIFPELTTAITDWFDYVA